MAAGEMEIAGALSRLETVKAHVEVRCIASERGQSYRLLEQPGGTGQKRIISEL